MLNEFVPFAVQCLYLHLDCLWKKTIDFEIPKMDHEKLKRSYLGVAEAHIERAKIEFEDRQEELQKPLEKDGNTIKKKKTPWGQPGRGPLKLKIEAWDLYKSKKTLLHALRILEFGSQLAETGTIYDFTKMNFVKPLLLAVESEQWLPHMEVFLPFFDSQKEKFIKLCEPSGDIKNV